VSCNRPPRATELAFEPAVPADLHVQNPDRGMTQKGGCRFQEEITLGPIATLEPRTPLDTGLQA